jgi:hypothetical protein
MYSKSSRPPFKINLQVNDGNLGLGSELKEGAGDGAKLLVVHGIIVKVDMDGSGGFADGRVLCGIAIMADFDDTDRLADRYSI